MDPLREGSDATDPENGGACPDTDSVPLCPSCLSPNHPTAHFCSKCGAPLTTYATTAPLESVLARGYCYRTAVSGRVPFVVVLGMWLIFVPQITVTVGFLVTIFSTMPGADQPWGPAPLASHLVGTAIASAAMAVYVAVLVKATCNYCRFGRHRQEIGPHPT